MERYDIILKGIFEKELYTTPPLMPVVVAKLTGTRQNIPEAFELTKELTPAVEMRHLRRIKNLVNGDIECIICKCGSQEADKNRELLVRLEKTFKDENIFRDFRLTHVPESAPQTNHQHKACLEIWPCKFAKSNYLIKCLEGSLFSEPEKKVLRFVINKCINVIESVDNHYSSVALVFKGRKVHGVGATSFEKASQNPVMHACMLAIDNVAKNAGGGYWISSECVNSLFSIDNELASFSALEDDRLGPFSPYLCTDYDIFTTEQPCFMCVMGLVQSRIRRLFYLDEESIKLIKIRKICFQDRAVDQFHIHRMKNLNHRFEAWRITLKPK